MRRKNFIVGLIIFGVFMFIIISKLCNYRSLEVWQNSNKSLPSEVRIGYQVSPSGELLAKANGAVEKKFSNTKIYWEKYDSGREVVEALAKGLIDMGSLGTPPAVLGIANNVPYKIYYIDDIIGDSEALVVKKDSGISLFSDLKGKRIATTFNSSSHYSLINALKLNKINPADVELIDMKMPEIYSAWQRYDIDGAYAWEPVKSRLVSEGGKILITSEDLAKKGVVTGEVGIVQNDFASKYPNFLKEYISVLNDSVHQYRDKPEESAIALSKEFSLPKDETIKLMYGVTVLDAKDQTNPQYIGTENNPGGFAKVLKDTGDFLASINSIKNSPDLSVYQQAILNNLYQ
ncbi:ABC transporter substrate-binding protein [Clostridium sp. YIM B02555]|uniref:taurine ABC transporter substrate-binding protein n=1 Tax=Clostridium sp. YIM B02555 TaxID=2911968 RepID=UPI001EED2A8C|nr:ABC transporter substrate-binding protein [Clostridium sp. YIM B02555]